jgi:sec-independent protein translocase protein TatB
MLDIGFSELLLIAMAAILFIGPKDYPVVIRAIAKAIREIKSLVRAVRTQVDEVMEQAGVNELRDSTKTIIDLEGKKQIAYDVSELDGLADKKSDPA